MKYSVEIEGKKVTVAKRPRKDFEFAVMYENRFCGLCVSQATSERVINREMKLHPEYVKEKFTFVPVIKG